MSRLDLPTPPPLPSNLADPVAAEKAIRDIWLSYQQLHDRLSSLLDAGVTLSSHLNGGTADLVVTGGKYPVTFKPKTKAVSVVLVAKVSPFSSTDTLTSAVTLQWDFTGGVVKINNIAGLTSNKKYKLRLVYLG